MSKQDSSKRKLVEQLRQMPIAHVACKRASVPRSTYYRWRKEDTAFAEACDEALREGIELISDLAESKVIAGISEGRTVYVLTWLKTHHLTYRRDRRDDPAREDYVRALAETRKKMKDFFDEPRDDDSTAEYDVDANALEDNDDTEEV